MYEVKLSKRAQKDLQKLKQSGLSKKAKSLVDILKENPWQNPPPYEKLVGDLNGFIPAGSTSSIGWCTRYMKTKKWWRSTACGRTTNKTQPNTESVYLN